ncbi:MAG: hypothetical protein WDA12_01265 [Bacilli bacterium]
MFTALTRGALVLLSITIMTILFTLLPFEIALPNDIYLFFTTGFLPDIFKTINYFVPLSFILNCIYFLFALRYFGIIFGFINWIWRKIFF